MPINDKMSKNYKILIATHPFSKTGKKPLELLEATGWTLKFNPYGRRLKVGDIEHIIKDVDAIIAGTEPYPIEILQKSKVKVICRVGIGLDNIPLKECKEMGISVTYTPDAPSQAVAELTVANIINLARYILPSDHSVREGTWNRLIGKLISDMTIGIIGVGRIGKLLVQLLQPFQPNLLVNDINPDLKFGKRYNLKWCSKEKIFTKSDIISLHIPGSKQNINYINRDIIARMKTGAALINTSRGTILEETALYDALIQGHLGGAALDVFSSEPYDGPLAKLDNVILTAHIGASAKGSRYLMELGAVDDCIRVLKGEKPKNNALTEGNINNQ
jgi:D-3-phosphoglycerate dehydrogenase / 2-oxoglutarate reductase